MLLHPQHDRIFNEPLLYFFYGKPVYSAKHEGYTSLNYSDPIYLVLKEDCISQVKRVFPFDTGAFVSGLFRSYFANNANISDFSLRLDETDDSANFSKVVTRFVEVIYKNNKNYFLNEPQLSRAYDPFNFELTAYLNLIKSKESANFDDRFSSIEVQSEAKVQLNSENLLAVMWPSYLADSEISRHLRNNYGSTKIIPYSTFRSAPNYYSALAVEKIGEFLEEKGYFS